MHCYQIYHSLIFKTIFSILRDTKVWKQEKLLYANDTQHPYGVCQNLLIVIAPESIDGIMAEYFGKLHVLLHDFNELLPHASTHSQELKQRSNFFMLLGLHGLPGDYSHVRDQIWDLLSCPILLPLVLPFYMCQVNTTLI